MKTNLRVIMLLVVLLSLVRTAYSESDLMKKTQGMFMPIPDTPPAIANNPSTPAKIDLGRMLYFDPRISKSGLISCNTCHNIGMGGIDYQETSIGHHWQKGPRNAPTVLNSVFNIAQFWDGRAADLKEQAKGPMQEDVEMGNKSEQIIKTLSSMPEYVDKFKKAFPDEANLITLNNMTRAIELFEATLLTPGSRFDKYLSGNDTALTSTEKEGLKLFMDKGCAACHGGVNMGGAGYFPFGVVEKPKEEITGGDVGRFKVTGVKTDQYVFKSPSLRNIALTPPYFHTGKVWSLISAVALMSSTQLGISLKENEIGKIVSFLGTTTGVQPKVEYPILPAPTDNTPRPNIN